MANARITGVADDRIIACANAVFVLFVAAVAVRWTFAATTWSTQVELTVVGLALEICGIALLALDFWWPLLRRARARLRIRDRARRAQSLAHNRIARLMGREVGAARISQVAVEVLVSNPPATVELPARLSEDEIVQRLQDTENRLRQLGNSTFSGAESTR